MGDLLFWGFFQRNKLRTTRLPVLIGKYFSSPTDQAEFRPNEDMDRVQRHGVSATCFASRITSGEIRESSHMARP